MELLEIVVGATVFAFLADLADLDATDGRGVTGAGRDGEAVGSLGSSILKGDAVGALTGDAETGAIEGDEVTGELEGNLKQVAGSLS